jgi:hypothetical protein
MWIYVQRTGNLYHAADPPSYAGKGYAGKGLGKNNPAMQSAHGLGPLPCGLYDVLAPVDTPSHGPFVLWLLPHATNEMWGRAGFGIHGDSREHPGAASEGCMIFGPGVRHKIWQSSDHVLKVVAEENDV